jgi:hypothetical protein
MKTHWLPLLLWFALAAIAMPLLASADAVSKTPEVNEDFCNLELAPFVFDLTEQEKAQAAKIETIYKKLRSTRSEKKRLNMPVPEYAQELRKIEKLLASLQPEIEIAVEELRTAYAQGRQDTFYRTAGHRPGTFSYTHNHPALLNFDIVSFIEMWRARIIEFAANGPSIQQMLFASAATAHFIENVMNLRTKMAFDEPITHENTRAYFARASSDGPNAVLNFIDDEWRYFIGDEIADAMFRKDSVNLTARAFEFFETSLEVVPELILLRNNKVIPIVIVEDELVSMDLMAELSWLNLQVLQVLPNTNRYRIHGTNVGPGFSWFHDTSHLTSTNPGRERSAYSVLRRYKAIVGKNHPEWIPLLKLLAFFHRHEDERQIENLPRELHRYLFAFRNPDPNMPQFIVRIQEELREPHMKQLFDSSWENFIRFLMDQRLGG